MLIQIITLFPEMFTGVIKTSMFYKAQKISAVNISIIDLRSFGLGQRRQVDDTPYGGGDGMLLMVEPIVSAIEYAKDLASDSCKIILPSPRGKKYQQSDAKRLACNNEDLIFICPRYEGYDERIISWVNEVYSIGNYVLTGGEIPVMAIVDSIIRLLPGVLGGSMSAYDESFYSDDKYIEFPQYTRPQKYKDMTVPEVLLSGNHQKIAAWRKSHSN